MDKQKWHRIWGGLIVAVMLWMAYGLYTIWGVFNVRTALAASAGVPITSTALVIPALIFFGTGIPLFIWFSVMYKRTK